MPNVPDMQPIRAHAPGKLVLCGDYAVLLGAPAVVLAVDRFAICEFEPSVESGWELAAIPLNERSRVKSSQDLSSDSDSAIERLFAVLNHTQPLPENAKFVVDTSAFYMNGEKLGVGSSAASLVASACVIGALREREFTFDELYAMHKCLHGNQGSGLDVAAAVAGGVIRYQNQQTVSIELPEELLWLCVYTGYGTTTEGMLAKFNEWVAKPDRILLDEWLQSAEEAAVSVTNSNTLLQAIERQNRLWQQVDRRAKLGAFGVEHREALKIAEQHGLIYKPSGAGGGDLGIVLGTDPERMQAFSEKIYATDLSIQSMSLSRTGCEIY